MTPVTPFCVAGPLPTGTTVLEASAGTGKTWTIAALAARYVAEGEATLDQLLLVTFGRMATSELRARVRERLVATERALSSAMSGAPARTDSPGASGQLGEAERTGRPTWARVHGRGVDRGHQVDHAGRVQGLGSNWPIRVLCM